MNITRSLSALVLAAAFAAPLAVAAQTAPAPMAPPSAVAPHHHHAKWMQALRSVGLTPDQRAKIKGMVADSKAANQNADPATKRANRRQLRSNIEGVLTPDQLAQYRAALAAQQAPPAPKS